MPTQRHGILVRITHWITTVCFFALLLSGMEIVVSHPRFYWGETGNIHSPALFRIPIPASRSSVPTGYGYVLPDQNGWSRALHFQSAWALVLTGLVYGVAGLVTNHFRKDLLPGQSDFSRNSFSAAITNHLRLRPGDPEDRSYNVLQRLAYSIVIFVLFPLAIWTGLAMSPSFDSAFPLPVTLLGGQQSARTIHFFVSLLLVGFLVIHVAMVCVSGFWKRIKAMTIGRTIKEEL